MKPDAMDVRVQETAVINPNLFVLSGGPGSGKTTVLMELEKAGFRCVPEVARQIIQEQVRTRGSALPWSDREAYTSLMLQRSIDSYLEHASATHSTFFDRGIPDTLGYAHLIDLPDKSQIESACRRFRYAPTVFIAPPWNDIYSTDSERKQDFKEAERTFQVVSKTYQECGYEIEILPKATPETRAQYILDMLRLK